LNRAGLEAASCECYKAMREAYDHLGVRRLVNHAAECRDAIGTKPH
jgi:hypothetical protein